MVESDNKFSILSAFYFAFELLNVSSIRLLFSPTGFISTSLTMYTPSTLYADFINWIYQ